MANKSNATDSIVTVDKLDYYTELLEAKMVDTFLPVGVYVQQDFADSPAARIPGTSWVKIEDKFLRAGSNTATGGADTHTLTEAQLAEHTHLQTFKKIQINPTAGGDGFMRAEDIAGNLLTQPTGSNAPHNNMPAYQNTHTYKRVA